MMMDGTEGVEGAKGRNDTRQKAKLAATRRIFSFPLLILRRMDLTLSPLLSRESE